MTREFYVGDYSMRALREEDLEIVLDWRNSPRVHDMMLTQHLISWEEHLNWYNRMCESGCMRGFIFSHGLNPIGYIGYTDYREEECRCSPGAYIGDLTSANPEAGLYLMFMAVEYAFSFLHMEYLETEVFSKNKKALRIDQFVGYQEVEQSLPCTYLKNGRNEDVTVLGLTKIEWPKRREKILNLL